MFNFRKSSLLSIIVIVIVVLITAVAVKAFTGPGTRQPGEGNPDFWIRSGTDVYYTGGNVSIGTMDPGTKLHIVGAVTITDPSTTLQLGDWGSYVCARNVEPTPGACPTGYTN